MERQEAYEIVTDKLLYFVAGGYTAQDTLREICHDSAFLLGDMRKEIEALKAKLQKVELENTALKEIMQSTRQLFASGIEAYDQIENAISGLEDTTCETEE